MYETKKTDYGSRLWKWFEVTNYRSLMRYCIFLNACMGFLHCKIESSRFVISKSRFSVSTILMVVYLATWLISLYKPNFLNPPHDTSILLHTVTIFVLGPLVVFSSYALNRTNVRLIQKMSDLTRQLPPKTFRRLAKFVYVKDMFQLIPFIMYLSVTQSITTSLLDSVTIYVSWYSFLTSMVVNAFYVNNIYVLNTCFERINDSLEELNGTMKTEELRLFRRVYHPRENSSLLLELEILKRQHLRISNVVRSMNESYGLQNLEILLLFFTDITFNVYHYVAFFIQPVAINTWFFNLNMFVVYYTLNMILTVWTIETIKDQEQRIGLNIHRIIVKTFDEQTITELQLFSFQVLQCKNTYLALGLPMNATLLTKLVCSVTTYVLILVQFLLIKVC